MGEYNEGSSAVYISSVLKTSIYFQETFFIAKDTYGVSVFSLILSIQRWIDIPTIQVFTQNVIIIALYTYQKYDNNYDDVISYSQFCCTTTCIKLNTDVFTINSTSISHRFLYFALGK